MRRTVMIAAAAVLCAAISCSRESCSEGEGGLSLSVSLDDAVTKASMTSDELLNTSKVDIYYADFSGLVRSYVYSEAPSTIWLPANEYRVDVTAGEAAKASPAMASWEQKSYRGSASFNIVAGGTTSVQVKAGVANAISQVSFAQSIAENFQTGYTLAIGVGDNVLVYDASNAGADAFFLLDGVDEPAFDWTFEGVRADGTPFTKSGAIPGILPGTRYKMSLGFTVKDGTLSFELLVDYGTEVIDDTIVFEAVSSGLSASAFHEVWAGHATVHGDADESDYPDAGSVAFSYSANGSSWITVPAVKGDDGSYSAVLKSLAPETEYSYRLMYGDEQIGDAMTFTTDSAPAVPNGGLERTSKSSSGNYTEFYASTGDTPWWGSGNGSKGVDGSADFGSFIICYPDTSTKKEGNQSACLESQWALVKFAAGNLFSGYFGGLEGTSGGKVYFGRPFTGRPTALRVWAKYSAGVINRVSDQPAGANIVKGSTYDTGRIQVALGKWTAKQYGGTNECPILVNTTKKSTFVDFATDTNTLAFGDLQLQSDATNRYNDWVQYTIPIVYRNETEMPTHIVISCAASMYGDYFTGCDSAKMWVDGFELLYE